MSHKAFYQTFFQTEQLFRRADDVMTFPALADVPAIEAPSSQVVRPEPVREVMADVPAVQISDPVVPAPVAEKSSAAPVDDLVAADLPVVPHTRVDLPGDAPAREPETGSIAPAQTPPTVIRPATPLISQKVLILVDEDLLPSDLLFLEKILKAVNLDVDGVDLLNVHGTKNVNFSELLAGKYIHHFFTFGVPFSRLNLDIMMDRYQPVRFEGITFLMADPLPAIEADVALKKKLWESLKKIFLWR
ncbi:MAG TPA: hypothetical protein VGB67_04180 [Fibrella sp.]|jgi:DNA polymerase III psi subunit